MRLTSLAQMRVIANPLRLRLLDAFVPEPRTTMQVARLLDESPTRLYRHVEALYRAGFLKRRGRRKNRGTTEQYYQATAGRFEAAPALFAKSSPAGAGFSRTVARLLRQAEQGLNAAISTGAHLADDGLVLTAFSVDGSAGEVARLGKRLVALINEGGFKGTGATWQGLIAFYPVAATARTAARK